MWVTGVQTCALPICMFRLSGNLICAYENQLNISGIVDQLHQLFPEEVPWITSHSAPCSSDLSYESILKSPIPCSCGIPLHRLPAKESRIWDFVPYKSQFQKYLSTLLHGRDMPAPMLLFRYHPPTSSPHSWVLPLHCHGWSKAPMLFPHQSRLPHERR